MAEHNNAAEQPSSKRVKTGQTATRSSVACSRCRRQKLRCSGGQPCQRCQKLGLANECSFPTSRGGSALSPADRLNQLETAVHSLRQVMGGQPEVPFYQAGMQGPSQTQGPMIPRPPDQVSHVQSPGSQGTNTTILPITPSDAWPSASPGPVHQLQQRQFIRTSPTAHSPSSTDYSASDMSKDRTNGLSPQAANTSALSLPTSWVRGGPIPSGPVPSSSTASVEPQSALSNGDRIQAPFGDVVFNKSVFENRELSRLPSPTAQAERPRPSNDVVELGIISIQMADYYYALFVQHCLPFLPVFLEDPPPSLNSLRTRSAFLSNVCITLGARIAPPHSSNDTREETSLYEALADRTELCLGSTLSRKILVFEDVQATLLMAGWGLRPNGEGADAWILSGHALRMAKRLGLDGPRTGVHQHSAKERERVWLLACVFDCYQALGFGRPGAFFQPATTGISINPDSNPSSSAAIFVVCQSELAGICHQLVHWVDEWRKAGVPPFPGHMLWSQLAPRLDEWSAKWVWPSSRFVCASTHISRLYGEHIRLCLALFVLKTIARNGSVPEGPKLSIVVATAVKAATVITQIAIDSGNTDEAISFAPDYNILTLAQAGLAIVSLTRPPQDAADALSEGLHPSEAAEVAEARPDENAAIYLLKALTSSLSRRDRSKTGLATFLSRKLQNAAACAGLFLDGSRSKDFVPSRPWSARQTPNTERGGFDIGTSQQLPDTGGMDGSSLPAQMEPTSWNDTLDPFFFFDPTLSNLWYGE